MCVFQLDDWVLCRIYKKKSPAQPLEQREENINVENVPSDHDHNARELQPMKIPRTFSLAHLWELESLGSISHLLGDHNTNYENNSGIETGVTMGIMPQLEPHSIKFEDNYHNNNLNQQSYFNPLFGFQ